jgi:very-short-patch-repair endonuclease
MRIKGIEHKTRLRAQGTEQPVVRRWLRNGAVSSIQPWYATAEAPPGIVELLQLGVRPTCLDSASLHGLWTPPHPGTHVFRPRLLVADGALVGVKALPVRRRKGKVITLAEEQDLVLHGPALRSWPTDDPVPELDLVLRHAALCLPVATAAVLFESALNRRRLSQREADRILAALPQRIRRPLSRIRADAESGTETAVRWWMETRQFPVRPQVLFPDGRRRMDLLVGPSWVIECDSREHHDDPLSYAEDRARDLYLASHGYRVTRLSWEQVFLQWEETQRVLLAMLRRGDHLEPPRP